MVTRRSSRTFLAFAVMLLLANTSEAARRVHPQTRGPRQCEPVRGTFTNQFFTGTTDCPTSPVGLCTEGQLSGDLTGSYAFTFLTSRPVGASFSFIASSFTGQSLITLENGTISGVDFGVLRQTPTPNQLAGFTTHLRIVSGDGAFEGASGHLTIQGRASFLTGEGAGTYVGVICTPR